MSEDKTYYWRDGLPTKPDVDLLIKTWPEPKPGDRFEYDEVCRVIGIEKTDRRFASVTKAWRNRLLKDSGVVIECDKGKAFYAAKGKEINSKTYSEFLGIWRRAQRHKRKLAIAARSPDEETRNTASHHGRLMHEITRYAKKSRMNLLPSTKTEPQPARVLPEKTGEGKS